LAPDQRVRGRARLATRVDPKPVIDGLHAQRVPGGAHDGTSLQPGMDGPGKDHRAVVDRDPDPPGFPSRSALP
jgi:hypothetical protein